MNDTITTRQDSTENNDDRYSDINDKCNNNNSLNWDDKLFYLHDILKHRYELMVQLPSDIVSNGNKMNEILKYDNNKMKKLHECIETEFNSILKLLLNDDYGYSKSDAIYTNIDEAKECLISNNNNEQFDSLSSFKKCCMLLNKCIKVKRPFNIGEMLLLFSKAKDAASIIHNKDIILFLGHTGSGKSTTIHFLAGSKMQKQKYGHIYPINVTNEYLKKIKTEWSMMNAVSRYINVVPIVSACGSDSNNKQNNNDNKNNNNSMNKAYIDDLPDENNTIYLCDSPGFGDTAGVEMDVCNSLGIIEAIKNTNRVIVVLVIDFHAIAGERLKGVKKLAGSLCNLLPGFDGHLKNGAIKVNLSVFFLLFFCSGAFFFFFACVCDR